MELGSLAILSDGYDNRHGGTPTRAAEEEGETCARSHSNTYTHRSVVKRVHNL